MDIDSLLESALGFFHQHTILIAAIAVVLLIIAIKFIKAALKFVLLLLVLAAFFYGVSLFKDTFSTGAKSVDQMVNKTKKVID